MIRKHASPVEKGQSALLVHPAKRVNLANSKKILPVINAPPAFIRKVPARLSAKSVRKGNIRTGLVNVKSALLASLAAMPTLIARVRNVADYVLKDIGAERVHHPQRKNTTSVQTN